MIRTTENLDVCHEQLEKEKVEIWSNKPKRDFIFTEDAADAVLKILNTDFTGIINLGSGKMSSLKLISEIIMTVLDQRFKPFKISAVIKHLY